MVNARIGTEGIEQLLNKIFVAICVEKKESEERIQEDEIRKNKILVARRKNVKSEYKITKYERTKLIQ